MFKGIISIVAAHNLAAQGWGDFLYSFSTVKRFCRIHNKKKLIKKSK